MNRVRRTQAALLALWVLACLWLGSNSGYALERYVRRSLAVGESHRRPVYVGLFVARDTEVLPNGVVRMITASCMFDECGVVFSPTKPPVIGEDHYEKLSDRWWQWERSW